MADKMSSRLRLRCGRVLLCGLLVPTPLQAAAETVRFDPPPQEKPWMPAAENAGADNPYQARRKAFREQAVQQASPTLPDRSVLLPSAQETAAAAPPPDTASPHDFHSPAAIIRHETFHLIPPAAARAEPMPELSDLVPAAGPADLETMVPLIPVPDPSQSSHDPEPQNVPQAAMPSAPSDIPPPPAVQEAPADAKYNTMALDHLLQQMQSPYEQTSAAPETLPAIPAPGGQASAAPASEPAPGLSTESKAILDKIPSDIERKEAGAAEDVDINRAKDTKYVSKTESAHKEDAEPATAQHETAGMKLAVKQMSVNIGYELEKAYNALISGHSHAAIEIYKNVLSNDPKNKDALFGLATTYHRAGQIDMARPLYGKLLSLDPKHRDALNNFLVLLADEAPQEALEQMEKMEAENPDFSPIPAQLAVIYQKLGQPDRASDKMFKAVALAPENLTYRYNLAILLDRQQKYEEAIKLYKQLVEAYMRGETLPGNIQKIQERLTFLRSNRN